MELTWPVILIIALFGIGGTIFIAIGLSSHFRDNVNPRTKQLEERENKLEQEMQDVRKKKCTLEKERAKLRQADEEVSDLDRRIDDIDWRLKDLEWEIRDTKWEEEEHLYQQKTSKATFWTVLGAAVFAVGGLIVSLSQILIN